VKFCRHRLLTKLEFVSIVFKIRLPIILVRFGKTNDARDLRI